MSNIAHTLKADGAAFDADGARVNTQGTTGVGTAVCGCGWMSAEYNTRAARKAAHADHKAEESSEPVVKATRTEILVDAAQGPQEPEPTPEADPAPIAPEKAAEALPRTTNTAATVIKYTHSRDFFAATARGTVTLLTDLGYLAQYSRGTQEVSIIGAPDPTAIHGAVTYIWAELVADWKAWKRVTKAERLAIRTGENGRKALFLTEEEYMFNYLAGVSEGLRDEAAPVEDASGRYTGWTLGAGSRSGLVRPLLAGGLL